MHKEKNKRVLRKKQSLFSVQNYVVFFLINAFTVSCCMIMFLTNLGTLPEHIEKSTILTFFNVIFLSYLLCVIDNVWRKLTIERPIKEILKATKKITEGDFSVRIAHRHGLKKTNELDAIIDNFNVMAQELQGIETLRTDFISNVSHEIKTPLSVIQNYAHVLQDKDLNEEKRIEYSKAIEESTKRLTSLITNILRLNKLENQQIYPKKMQYDLGNQLCECILGFEAVWETKNLNMEINIEEDIKIHADQELMSIVWNNLISNAIKFTPEEGSVWIRLKQEDGWAIVEVKDTGCGIKSEDGYRIFEKFYQSDQSHGMQGNGLGLALVKRVIDITGGEISVESKLGKGSTFTVRIRL